MALEFRVHFENNSREAKVIQNFAEQQHITPQEAAHRLFVETIGARIEKSPAEELLGAISTPKDCKIVDAARDFVRLNRKNYDIIRDFGA